MRVPLKINIFWCRNCSAEQYYDVIDGLQVCMEAAVSKSLPVGITGYGCSRAIYLIVKGEIPRRFWHGSGHTFQLKQQQLEAREEHVRDLQSGATNGGTYS